MVVVRLALPVAFGLGVGSTVLAFYMLGSTPRPTPEQQPPALRAPAQIPHAEDPKPSPQRDEVSAPAQNSSQPANNKVQVDPLVEVGDALRTFADLAKKAGLEIPDDLDAPPKMSADLLDAYKERKDKIKAIEAVRQPLLHQIAAEKRAAGDMEHPVHPSTISDPKERAAADKARIAANQPTQPGQTVVVGGAGPRIDIIRINESDDARLPGINQSVRDVNETFVNRVALLFAASGRPLNTKK